MLDNTSNASPEKLKQLIKEKYGEIALQSKEFNKASCCGSGGACCGPVEYAVMAEDYSSLPGYIADADLGLGCGLPTEFAQITQGDTVVDLGSGAGNDAFVARSIVGEQGKVIGIDMTEPMIEKARANAKKLRFTNVEFRLGDIENMPIENDTADVVVSNCVMNLVPNKQKAFAETFRILKSGGHFSISDIVLRGELPPALKNAAVLYAGCVAGAQQMDEYLATIKEAGFVNITIQKEREINVPNELLLQFITLDQLRELKKQNVGIYSITVYADKP
ncbi:MAG: arsenite methyltransferase [Bacteroidota bacterium]